MKNLPIGQLLLEQGYITEDQLNKALAYQKTHPGNRLGDVLIELGYITEEKKLKALSVRLNVPVYEGFQIMVNSDIVRLISEEVAKKYQVMPLEIKNNALQLATSDPLDFYALEDIKASCGIPVSPVLAPKEMIENAIRRNYAEANVSSAIDEIQKDLTEDQDLALNDELSELTQRVDNAPVVKFVNNMIRQAYEIGASDIHIEPFELTTVIRFRTDGVLHEFTRIAKSVHEALITRIKIMGNMNIAEKRIPQDGHIESQIDGKSLDIRLSSLPTVYGEKMVIRLLGHSLQELSTLKDLGLQQKDYDLMETMIHQPYGILLFTGPTGSGKTTTLYAILNELAREEVNVITIEDPVEKRMMGVNQVQVNTKAGLTFASALRSILRQDPDVIMIGEIRDEETAEIAVRSAITGHYVLSTIHTNDSATAIARLKDMNVEPYLLASSVVGIVAQRLVRQLCPHCKQQIVPTTEQSQLLGGYTGPIYKPHGCPRCNQTGYKGRTALFEILPLTAEIRDLIVSSNDTNKIKDAAVREGMTTLSEEMIKMIVKGQTSMEEMLRVIYTI
ncbi:GspE/PulE family protein [Holdemania massiliensis]|uniref:GspE/PulE family protein n=1 Tax=Holdemania massiliensis TaxID=1468449 RepID=UPI001F06A2FF|nr:type II/IV secretion system protein [Holdemania massiliensis]MCH1941047.1 Flp pilus assembly complex ATPase component TadA [Holdemania massiliensis]